MSQLLALFFWHFSDMPRQPDDVRSPGQRRHPAARPRLPFLTDAVEKRLAIIGFAIGGRFRSIPGRALPPDRRTPEPTCQASYAIDAHTPSVGGPSIRSAIVLRFCTMAAR